MGAIARVVYPPMREWGPEFAGNEMGTEKSESFRMGMDSSPSAR